MLNRFAFVAVPLLWLAASGAANAQSWMQVIPGVWTPGDASACRTQFYTVAVSGNQLQFRDQAGRISVETILERRADGLVTATTRSFSVQAGTRWDYSVVGNAELRMRDVARGRTIVLTRCPADDAAAAAQAGSVRSVAFIQEYFRTWSSDPGTALAFIGRSYPSQLEYFGKQVSKDTVTAAKAAFLARWPSRSYTLSPGTVSVDCTPDGVACTIAGMVDWACSSAERHAEASGTSTFALRVAFDGGTAMVTTEGGTTQARKPVAAGEASRHAGDAQPGEIELSPIRR